MATNAPTATTNLFDQFDAEAHAKTQEYRDQHQAHWFTYTSKIQEAHKPRPDAKAPKNPSPIEAAYRNDMAAIAAKYNQAHPDCFFFYTALKVETRIKATSKQHNTRPLL